MKYLMPMLLQNIKRSKYLSAVGTGTHRDPVTEKSGPSALIGSENPSCFWFWTKEDSLPRDRYIPRVGDTLRTGRLDTGGGQLTQLNLKKRGTFVCNSAALFSLWPGNDVWPGAGRALASGTSIGANGWCMFDQQVGRSWQNWSTELECGAEKQVGSVFEKFLSWW